MSRNYLRIKPHVPWITTDRRGESLESPLLLLPEPAVLSVHASFAFVWEIPFYPECTVIIQKFPLFMEGTVERSDLDVGDSRPGIGAGADVPGKRSA